jgi:hypothetical protein
MIVVVGLPAFVDAPDGESCAGGQAVAIALAARRRGADVELAGKVGADGAGEAVVLALGKAGVGHAALLRDPARPTPLLAEPAAPTDDTAPIDEIAATYETAGDPGDAPATTVPRLLPEDPAERPGLDAGDVELALRYLPAARVVVLTDQLSSAAAAAGLDGAAFSAARAILLRRSGDADTTALGPLAGEATVLESPARDDGSFAALVGAYASNLDAGAEPGPAFTDAVATAGWEQVPG